MGPIFYLFKVVILFGINLGTLDCEEGTLTTTLFIQFHNGAYEAMIIVKLHQYFVNLTNFTVNFHNI